MNNDGDDAGSRLNKLLLFSLVLLFAVPRAYAQTGDVISAAVDSGVTVVTNVSQITPLFDSWAVPPLVYPYESVMFEGVDNWWLDFSRLPDALAAVRSYPSGRQMEGVTQWPLQLIRDAATGQITLSYPYFEAELMEIEAPTNYVPFQQYNTVLGTWCRLYGNTSTSYEELVATGNWFLEPPRVVLSVWVADVNDLPTWNANVQADQAAEQEAEMEAATNTSNSSPVSEARGGGMMMLMDNQESCTITNETDPFSILSITMDGQGCTLTWESCSDHVYGVYTTEEMSYTNVWTSQHWMFGEDGATSWTDTNAPSFQARFYRVERLTLDGDEDGDGVPNWWEVQNGLNPVDPSDATQDPDGDGYGTWDEYLMMTDPANANDPITIYVDSMNTNGVWDGTQAHPFRTIQDAIECSVSVSSNLAIRVRPGTYYETVSSQAYACTGSVVAARMFLYIYAANSDWSLSTDPEQHIIDSLGMPNREVLGCIATPAPAVEFFNVMRARINGFTIRGGAGTYGGGILAFSQSGPIYISNCIIEKNGGLSTEVGGIFLQAPTNSLIYNTVVAKNSGLVGGIGDIYGARIWNCTVVSNENFETDVGAVSGDLGMPTVRNCVIWGNGLDVVYADVDYSTFDSNQLVAAGAYNLTNDPQLVTTAFGNYRLQTGSPMIGMGAWLPIEKRDLYGNPRPASGGFDIGANEFTDSDGDGMQDDWETKHGLNPGSGADASGNPDGDGFNNLQEYNHNTDPNNADTDGDGIPDDQDPDPTEPDVTVFTWFWDIYYQNVWDTSVDGFHDPRWRYWPGEFPTVVTLVNKHIGDHLSLEWDPVTFNSPLVVIWQVPVQQRGGKPCGCSTTVPDANASPLGQLGPVTWGVNVTQTTPTNSQVCAGFDDETPQFYPGTIPALSVPQGETNTFTTIINPTNVVGQIIFPTDNPTLATASPSPAVTASQLVSVAGLATGNTLTSTVLRVKGFGAQNSYTTLCSQVAIDVLPRRTNVTVAIYAITATGEPTSAPTNLPTQASLQNYLNQVYGQQANVYFTVWPMITNTVPYDLNSNTVMDAETTNEYGTIINYVNTNATIIVYYVHSIAFMGSPGGAFSLVPGTPYTFVSDRHSNSVENITAHEIGLHFGTPHEVVPPSLVARNPSLYVPGNPDRIMWWKGLASNPCRLSRDEWTNVNIAASHY